MADVGNVNRQATARALASAFDTVKAVTGLVIQTHRLYESPSRMGKGLTQDELANQADCSQTLISNLEQGKSFPGDETLLKILKICGFNMESGHGGHALFALLRVIRDEQVGINTVEADLPQ